MRPRVRPLVALAVAAALALPGCAAGAGDRADAHNTTPTTAPSTTPVSAVSVDHPLSVVIAGDSVMDNLAEAIVPALDRGGEAVVSHTWLLGLTRDAASKVEMDRTVAATHADLVVVLLGVWELDPLHGEIGTRGWEQRYDRAVLDPFVDRVTARGAHLLWLGMPATADPVVTRELDELNHVYTDLDRRDPRVSFLDLSDVLEGPHRSYAERLPDATGTSVRVRQTDGLHLCAAGTERAVTAVLSWITDRWAVPLAPHWQDGAWRDRIGVDDGEHRCPVD